VLAGSRGEFWGGLQFATCQSFEELRFGTGGIDLGRSVGALTSRKILTIFMVMTETRSLADIKAHLSEVVDRVEYQHDRVVLTRNGRPAAVLVSPDELEALEDTLDLLSNPQALKEIAIARSDISKGRVIDSETLRAKYLAR